MIIGVTMMKMQYVLIRILLFIVMIDNTYTYNIKPAKKFPKISYIKIHDISYRKPIYIRKHRPFLFNLIIQLNKTLSNC